MFSLEPFKLILKNAHILFSITLYDLKRKYAGSVLGFSWFFIYPLLFLAIYSVVYLFIFKIKIPAYSNWNYVLIVFCGLIPYFGFSETLQQGSQALSSNQNLVKNTIFPISLIPVKSVFVSQIIHAMNLGVLTAFVAVGGFLSPKIFLVPVIFLIQYLFLQGIVWFISALSIVVRDIQHLLNLFLLMLLFISPIAFTADMVPGVLSKLLYLNPLFYVITLYRASFFDTIPFPVWLMAVFFVFSTLIFSAGFLFFKRVEERLWEYV